MKTIFASFSILFLIYNCGNVLTNGSASDTAKLEWQVVTEVTDSAARVSWKCSGNVVGFLKTSGSNLDRLDSTFFPSTLHSVYLTNLTSNLTYNYVTACGASEGGIGLPSTFTTLANNNVIYTRSIWMVGGIGSDKNAVADIDYYDPVNNTWSSSVTQIPTPRINAQIVSYKNKIYVIGGIVKSGASYTMSRLVEAYDPFTNTWSSGLASMPATLQGGIVGSFGEEIAIIGGTTSTDMTTGTILNTVYKYSPDIGSGGTWSNFLSSTTIYPRIDMAGCTYNGSLFFTGGRFYNDGLAYATSDAYSPSLNSTTGKIEASISLARHGAAYACYRPSSSDTYSTDSPLFLIAGGSTATDIVQPVSSITTSNRFEYSVLGSSTNAFVTGSNIPVSLYYPSMEISYQQRKAYLFGGAPEINLPVNTVYSLDLSNPGGNPWNLETKTMPRSRFGHKAVILSR
jgi:N-acetylneuraminic acid mutarotase